jgi:putative membrane protein
MTGATFKMKFLARVLVTTLVFMGYATFFPNNFYVSSIGVAIFAAVVLSILNVIVKPILTILSLPFIIVTFGLFTVIINAFILQLTSFFVGSSVFGFSGFGSSLLLAIILTVVYWIVADYVKRNKKEEKS